MKKSFFKQRAAIGAIALALGGAVSSQAVSVGLFERNSNIDGTVTFEEGDGINTFPYSPVPTKSYSYQVSGAGSHFLGFYIDLEIDEAINSFFNEYGTPLNSPQANQSWEIDEPGFVFGDIYDNFSASDETGSLLDNSNGVPSGSPDDVAIALGWDVTLGAFDEATATFFVGEVPPTSGFYLSHTDPDSSYSLFYWSTLTVDTTPPPPGVPDGGGTLILLLAGFGSLATMLSRKPRS